MKVWYHLVAATVGLALAALIVYLVFGSASQEGAVQDGDAGSLAAGGGACGTIAPAATGSRDARAKADASPPALSDAKGPIAAISSDRPQQRAWVARVHAASGLCLDEIRIENSAPADAPATNIITATMSTVDGVDDAAAGAYAAGVLAQSFTEPFFPRTVTVQSTVGESERTIRMSSRAWRAFDLRRRTLKRPVTVANLKLFQQATAYRPADLRITGW